jgi:hypothetical protein
MLIPSDIKIFHITHIDNLKSIIDDNCIWSDSEMLTYGKEYNNVGISSIKTRRMNMLIDCYKNDFVGDYVPFNFCPRSVMLYLLHCSNHQDLLYRGGQEPIVHLQSDLKSTVLWADDNEVRWSFTPSNAGAAYTIFYNNLAHLNEIDWEAVNSLDFRNTQIKEFKQAEFLIHKQFPWHLVETIGAYSAGILRQVEKLTLDCHYKPQLAVKPEWYY